MLMTMTLKTIFSWKQVENRRSNCITKHLFLSCTSVPRNNAQIFAIKLRILKKKIVLLIIINKTNQTKYSGISWSIVFRRSFLFSLQNSNKKKLKTSTLIIRGKFFIPFFPISKSVQYPFNKNNKPKKKL